jgi:two-component system, chemotaxis family, protein-glutamate methylesterase/glutaminase
VVGASAGGLNPLRAITEALPRECGATFFVVVHIGKIPSVLPEILSWHGRLPVAFASDGEPIKPGHIYVAPSDRHMVLAEQHILLSDAPFVHHTRPAIDPLFMSAAETFGERVIGIVLSGTGSDGAAGLAAIKKGGGVALVQEPGEASSPGMPQAAIAADAPERLEVAEIARRVVGFCAQRKMAGSG